MRVLGVFLFLFCCGISAFSQANNPQTVPIVFSDITHFFQAYDAAAPDFKPETFQKMYLDKGSKGIPGFMNQRIRSAEHLAKVVSKRPRYYQSIRSSLDSIPLMEAQIRESFQNFKSIYPEATFPPVYFVIGALSSGGTTSGAGILIGSEFYGRTAETPMEELNDWLKTVIKPVSEVPHIVAHELVHVQQTYDGGSLLQACLKEGSADFIAELISGKHINANVHDFANPREKELWSEFQSRMMKKDYSGWLYSSTEGRPNDLGYWMGYQISKAYYENSPNKQKAIHDILHIKNAKKFLEKSGYADKFK